MQKISKEKKLLFLIDGFNVNLLNYECHNDTNDFINTMISHYLLPYILHPARVIDHSATVIDNIFQIMCQSIPSLTIPPPWATPGDSHILVAPGVGFSLLCLARGSAWGFALGGLKSK